MNEKIYATKIGSNIDEVDQNPVYESIVRDISKAIEAIKYKLEPVLRDIEPQETRKGIHGAKLHDTLQSIAESLDDLYRRIVV